MSRRTEKPFWDPDELQAQFRTEVLGKRLIVFNRITSTNDFLKRLARRGAEAGTLVLADQQTAGRGRLGRSWQSPPNVGLWLSFLVRPELPLERIGALPLTIAVVVAESLSAICGEIFSVKWPNDILWRQRKICGILCEAQIAPMENSPQQNDIVAGIGINVNQQTKDFSPEWRTRAVSLAMLAERPFDRQKVFIELVQRLDKNLFENLRENIPFLLSRWRSFCPELGKRIRLHYLRETITGVFEDLGAAGELILRMPDGQRQIFSAGEVSMAN
jgi:BirA family biotin operon repressor/biotin-[acetyl-CoA-carboxylase] ligase